MACALMLAPSEPPALAGDGSSGKEVCRVHVKIVTSLERRVGSGRSNIGIYDICDRICGNHPNRLLT